MSFNVCHVKTICIALIISTESLYRGAEVCKYVIMSIQQ